MPEILHIIQELTPGGAARAMMAKARYSAGMSNYRHSVLPLRPLPAHSDGAEMAKEHGLRVLSYSSAQELKQHLAAADIVELQWWNNPEMAALLRSDLPPLRLIAWFHVGGHHAPQVITNDILKFVDFGVACSPFTLEAPVFRAKDIADLPHRTGMAYGAADFARLAGLKRHPHTRFNIGYIGTVDFIKMHPRYVELNAGVKITEARFIVCGSGGAVDTIRQLAHNLGDQRFDIRGYVEDIKSVIEELDIYGYPLCEDTYAASEINLQEVMFAGIPPVVFPYGGIRHLVKHGQTGLVVNSDQEYQHAIEFLYNNPVERERLGKNAAEYASRVFGSENSAHLFNSYYDGLLAQPKRLRVWGKDSRVSLASQPISLRDLQSSHERAPGHEIFIESLGETGSIFRLNMQELPVLQVLASDDEISRMTQLMRTGGVLLYRNYYPTDPYLRFWHGLLTLSHGLSGEALGEFAAAIENGLNSWRAIYHFGRAARAAGQTSLYENAINALRQLKPDVVQLLQQS